ncbi:MAG: 3-keto-5-aminohexanoate cleavage protein [Deltaproteobacteria bacterium]|jgi:3-keto-5-aminohexanoate cleavage enzyme|nr:3-keto-5-aminohexanoate cleavage protein [Deltaproteobacteria bacterium]
MEKLVITVATTGAVTSRKEHPEIPLHPGEIAESVYEAYRAGAAVAHIHVRDDAGDPSMSLDKFRETVELVREKCDIILNLTTSGGRGLPLTDEDRFAHLALKPEMCSMDCGTMNFGERIFSNSPQFLRKLGKAALAAGVKPEIEVFDTAFITNALRLAQEGCLAEPLHFQFVLGVRGGMDATPENLLFLLRQVPAGSTWSVIGIGKGHLPLSAMALHMGGHVRVGMEDNVLYRRRTPVKNNAQFVERIVRLAEEFERPVATVAEARKILGLA